MDEKIIDIILSDSRTLEEAYRLDDELRLVQQESFRLGQNGTKVKAGEVPSLSSRVKDHISSRTYQKIKELEGKGFIDVKNHEALRVFFEQLHVTIMNMPRLQLQLAYELNEEGLNGIYSWIKKEIKTRLFLDVVLKPQLLAGCVIVYRGVYKDYSLRTNLHAKARETFEPILAMFDNR